MAAGDTTSVLSHGLLVSSGGTCDYPGETDVRANIDYGDGLYTGNLVLPGISVVRRGVRYGANGSQYTGSFVCPGASGGGGTIPSGSDALWANQSVTVPEVLDAFQNLLEKATGFASERVLEWHYESRPNVEAGRTIVWFRYVDEDVDDESGAGRHGTKSECHIEIRITTRGFSDPNQKDKRLFRAAHATRMLIVNAIHGRMLHPSYQDRIVPEPPMPDVAIYTAADRLARRRGVVGSPIQILTYGTMTARQIAEPERTRPEQGYVDFKLLIRVPTVLRVTTNDVPLLG